MTELSDEANDALFYICAGKSPSSEIVQGVQAAISELKVSNEYSVLANALLRVIGGYGTEDTLITMLQDFCTERNMAGEGEIIEQYADSEVDGPKQFDRSQLSGVMLEILDIDRKSLVDPSSRVGEKTKNTSTEEDVASCVEGLIKFLDSPPWQIMVGVWTAWALFATDIALWVLPKAADIPIAVITFLVFLGFSFEFTANILTGRDYGSDVGDLFFWLDFVGTFSLIPDFLILFGYDLAVPDNVVLARVARAARIGARLSRLTKVFRVKDGDSSFTAMLKEKGIDMDEEEEEDVSSQVGAKVADGISKKVVVLVIVLLVFVPIFTYQEPRGGQKQTKEEAMHMLYSLRGDARDATDSTARAHKSITLGTCSRPCTVALWHNLDSNPPDQAQADCDALNDAALFSNDDDLAIPGDRAFKNVPQVPYGMATDGTGYGKDCAQDNSNCGMDVDGGDWCVQAGSGLNAGAQTFNGWPNLVMGPGHHLNVYPGKTAMSKPEKKAMAELLSLQGDPAIYFTWNRDDDTGGSIFFEWADRIEELRASEIRRYGDTVDEYELKEGEHKSLEVKHRYGGMEMWVDLQDKTASEAALNIVYMWFVIVIFAISSLVFMGDIQSLVIEPVEGMTKAMKMIATSLIDLGGNEKHANEANYIESSVLKIVSLLNVSFGDAGRRVIDRCEVDQSPVDAPGLSVTGVYGMSDIRQFTSVTEALNQDIVLFVNEFGNICHKNAVAHFGAPNKNIGDAFLCVWIEGRQNPGPQQSAPNLANQALDAYRQAIQQIRSSKNLGTLCKRREMKTRFPDEQQPHGEFLPEMGFGLHYGTSVEGIMGTERKMDATYLGAAVDLSDRLEEMTKEYKTPILMTEVFYEKLDDAHKATCRLIDFVTDGIEEPFKLYAANVGYTEPFVYPKPKFANFFDRGLEEDVFPDESKSLLKGDQVSNADKLVDQLVDDPEDDAETGKADAKEDTTDVQEEEPEEPELPEMTKGQEMDGEQLEKLIDPWNEQFEEAVQKYIDGDWSGAKSTLDDCLRERDFDGPANYLLNLINDNKGRKPRDWQANDWSK